MNIKHWYLVIIQFSEATDSLAERLTRDVPTIIATLKKLSNDNFRPLLQSKTGETACWLLRTSANSKQIISRINNPEATEEDILRYRELPADTSRKGDKIVAFQLGDDRFLAAFNRIQSWLDQNWNRD